MNDKEFKTVKWFRPIDMHSIKFNTCIAIKDTDISTVTLRQIKCAHITNVWDGFKSILNTYGTIIRYPRIYYVDYVFNSFNKIST